MRVVSASLRTFRGFGARGGTKKDCPVCGKNRLDRLRVQFKYDTPDENGYTVSMQNICQVGCIYFFFGVDVGCGVIRSAGKVTKKYSRHGFCLRCRGAALGGVWVSVFNMDVVRMYRGPAVGGAFYMFCAKCFVDRLYEVEQIRVLRGVVL